MFYFTKTLVFTYLVVMLAVIHGLTNEPVLPCASCAGVHCGNPPENCELDKIPCGCCPTCVRLDGQLCEAFSPRCGYGLKCLTPAGLLDGRPKWYQQYLKGTCVKDPFALTTTTGAP